MFLAVLLTLSFFPANLSLHAAAEESDVTVSYQAFLNGEPNGKYVSQEELETGAEYDGYLKVEQQGTEVRVTPVAKDGYEFMMLCLTDDQGTCSTPFTKDYAKVESGRDSEHITGQDYTYTFTVDPEQETATAFESLGTRYKTMPGMKAYFDPVGDLLNDDLLAMTPQDSRQTNTNAVIGWLGTTTEKPMSGTLHVGVPGAWGVWNGVDCGNGDYVTYYAGEGKSFQVSAAIAYSRLYFSDNRFAATVEGSNTGEEYETILELTNGTAAEKSAVLRRTVDSNQQYSYIRLRANTNNTDISLLKLYGSVVTVDGQPSEPENPETAGTEYQAFKGGNCVQTAGSLEELQADSAAGYDGYVKVEKNGTAVTVTPVAAEGYEFMMLTLVDEAVTDRENAATPLTKDYKKEPGGASEVEEATCSYTFTVDEAQPTATDFENIGLVYNRMPTIRAYFDPQGDLLNDDLLAMTPQDSSQTRDNAVTSWLGATQENPMYGTLHVGTGGSWGAWNGVDSGNGDYATYYAGDGKAFHITAAALYSRVYFSKNRFSAVVEGSTDGVTFQPVLEAKNSDWKENFSMVRQGMQDEVTYPYIRLKATTNNADISLLKLYGTVIDFDQDPAQVEYQAFRDGARVATYATLEDLQADTATAYEGYVKVETADHSVRVTVTENSGYNFMLMNLKDAAGNVTTPLSRDYTKTGDGTHAETNGQYTYAFTVDREAETALESGTIGTVYQEMPELEVLFDRDSPLINEALLGMEPVESQISNADKSIVRWIDTEKATLNAGVDYWDGVDVAAGDYITYYAGDGKAFCLSDLSIYSRRGWSDSRFTGVVEASNDGDQFVTIFSTENTPASEKYSIKRMSASPDLKFRMLRIRATAKNTDINLLKLFGSVQEVADGELSELKEAEAPLELPEITDYVVPINEIVSEAGFIHPGVGITKTELENVREQVAQQRDPWFSYYQNLVSSAYASREFACNNSIDGETPRDDNYDSQGMKNRAGADGERAYTQALLYVITGDEVYRSNAIRIIRIWEQMDPTKYKYFVDAHIHTGWGLYRMIQAAEILRYTGCQSEELAWTEEDTRKFTANVVDPTVNTFLNFNDKFMNQHNFPLNGTLAAAIFKDDREEYNEKVEWTTVNSTADDPYYTGSIQWLYRLMTENEMTGEAIPPEQQQVQLIEMGRDLAHAGDDAGTLPNLARMIDLQGTRVDPEDGTVSTADDAVNVYEFLDNRILRGTDYFCRYELGYDVDWTPARTSQGSEEYPASYYTIPSDEYRGRLYTVGLADLYYVYVYRLGYTEEELTEMAPYYMQAFKQKCGPVYYAAGSGEETDLGRNTTDGGWLYIPAEVATDDNETAKDVPEATAGSNKYIFEPENQFSIIDGSNQVKESTDTIQVQEEGDIGYIHTTASQGNTMFAVYNLSLINRKGQSLVGLRFRTNDNVVLEIKKEPDLEPFHTLQLPNTHGQWQNIVFDMGYDTVTAGQYPAVTHLMYFNVVGEGQTVDIDHINMNAGGTLSAPQFNQVTGSVMNLAVSVTDPYTYDFSATDSNTFHNERLTYELQGDTLDGAELNPATGSFRWDTSRVQPGTYTSYVIVSDGTSLTSVRLNILVGKDRTDTVQMVHDSIDWSKEYLTVNTEDFEMAAKQVSALEQTASAQEFYAAMESVWQAVNAFTEVNPLLEDGSLNFPLMVQSTSLADGKLESLVDNNAVTFTGDLTSKYFTLDFGAFYTVKVSSFGLQPRNIWPDRMAGCVVMGSVDGETWDTLTDPAAYQDDLQTLPVKPEYQEKAYRYLKVSSVWPDSTDKYAARASILSLGEFRIYGTRQEIESQIRTVSISTDAEPITNHIGNMSCTQSYPKRALPGNTITLDIVAKQPLEAVKVTIAGLEAQVTEKDELTYTASVQLTDQAALQNASKSATFDIQYQYRNEDGQMVSGDPVSMTTDGTAVLVSSDEQSIDLNGRYYYSSWNNDGVERKTQQDIAAEIGHVTDSNSTTVSDARQANGSGSGSYIIVDFGENRGVSLHRAETLSRLDQLGRSTGMYIQGCNDYDDATHQGSWQTLTKSTLYSAEWQGIEVSDHRYYRYIRFINNGNWFGNMAEIRLFGTETNDLAAAVDKTTLAGLVAQAQELETTDYQADSWKMFETALKAAQDGLKDDGLTQDEVDVLVKNLQAAMDGLQLKNDTPDSTSAPSTGTTQVPDTKQEEKEKTEPVAATEKVAPESMPNESDTQQTVPPETGDDSQLGCLIAIMGISLVLLIGAGVMRKKYR